MNLKLKEIRLLQSSLNDEHNLNLNYSSMPTREQIALRTRFPFGGVLELDVEVPRNAYQALDLWWKLEAMANQTGEDEKSPLGRGIFTDPG